MAGKRGRLACVMIILLLTTGCAAPLKTTPIPSSNIAPTPNEEVTPVPNTPLPNSPQPSPTPTATSQPIPALDTEATVTLKVFKSARLLEVWVDGACLASYPVGLGSNPVGHKQVEGDGKTPEGSYYISYKNPHSDYYKSMWISYPNAEDAQAGFDAGRITQGQLNSIRQAIENGERPDWTTPLGGMIAIHGHGAARDWTAGCMAVADDVMDILWPVCPVGTAVYIFN